MEIPSDIIARLDEAHLPALVAATYLMTGDPCWLDERFDARYTLGELLGEQFRGGYAPEVIDEIKRGAALALAGFAPGQHPRPDARSFARLMRIVAGTDVPPDYADFLWEELQIAATDSKRPSWQLSGPPAENDHVVVIGAGMSGLLMGLRLQQAGIPFTIVEKNPDVGGTWLENSYPGCRVDNSNHMYSYSFEPTHAFPFYFSTQPVLLDYFRDFADRHALRDAIRFGTKVRRAEYDDIRALWRIEITGPDGADETIEARALVSAVGQLNQPRLPDIPGIDDFAGLRFHSARWDHDVNLDGRRVGIVGTGASAYQFAPEIAPRVGDLAIFQRTPPWGIPRPHYHDAVPATKQWLLANIPFYARWYRFWLFWSSSDSLYPTVLGDPAWAGRTDAISARNAEMRDMLAAAMLAQLEGRDDLRAQVMPDYPFGGKRALLDNGVWIEMLKRPNAHLVTSAIDRVVADGVVTRDGEHHKLDVMIYGTGFEASHFLSSLEVVGRDGLRLRDYWDGDARAYLGMTVPHFPNFFMLYGPNTNVVVNGSIIFFSECATRYVIEALRPVFEGDVRALEVKETVYSAFNERVDRANERMAWGTPGASNWYKNAKGRVSQNWPFPVFDYWQATRTPDMNDFEVERATPSIGEAA